MRKLKKILMCFIAILAVVTLVGCNKKEEDSKDPIDEKVYYTVTFDSKNGTQIESVKVEKGKTVAEPTAPTKENYTFLGWYTTEKVSEENLYKFDTPVTADLKLFAGLEVKKQILVLSVEQNSYFVEFNANKEEKENKKTEFFDRTQKYLVGDDNAWSVKPETTFINYNPVTGDTEPITVKSWEYEIKVFLKNGEELTDVTTNKEYIENIDKVNCTIDFADTAIDSEYKVEVVPTGLTEKQLKNIEKYTTSFEFKVVDGFNAYSALDLTYLENRTKGKAAEAWKAFKEEKQIKTDYLPSMIIVHKDLEITVNDLPSYFFYQENEVSKTDPDYVRALGSMKDNMDIYIREINKAEQFVLSGNYFTISSGTLREVVRESGKPTPEGEVMSHSVLFRFKGFGKSRMENINFVGNAPRVENVIKAGGHILHKANDTDFTAYNLITSCYFITYFPEYDLKNYLIEQCKAYDAFNCFVYNWGCKTLVIKDSEMIGAGGPIVIQDHVHPEHEDGGNSPATKFINSKLESYVTGNEGWFTVVHASGLVPKIKDLNAVFTPFGRSFLKTSKDGKLSFFNFISITKSGNAEGITGEPIEGSLTINDKTFDYGKNNPYLNAMLKQTFGKAPVFESIKSTIESGYGFFNGQAVIDAKMQPIMDVNNPLFQGDYLCVYFNGMSFVMGYGEAGQIYETTI